jgi:hypothetical protein
MSLLLVLFAGKLPAQSIVTTDGPYVRYIEDQITVTTIQQEDDFVKSQAARYQATDKSNINLLVSPAGHPEWAFSVSLKPAIESE